MNPKIFVFKDIPLFWANFKIEFFKLSIIKLLRNKLNNWISEEELVVYNFICLSDTLAKGLFNFKTLAWLITKFDLTRTILELERVKGRTPDCKFFPKYCLERACYIFFKNKAPSFKLKKTSIINITIKLALISDK